MSNERSFISAEHFDRDFHTGSQSREHAQQSRGPLTFDDLSFRAATTVAGRGASL
jgi:hypothetical protein